MGNQHGKGRRDLVGRLHWTSEDCPSPPGKPYLDPDSSEKHGDIITIRWSPPAFNGGASICGYLVEHKRTGSPHWLRATPHLILDTKLALTGLEPGWRYQFRVSAENQVGLSSPSELSEPLIVTPQKWAASAPFFNVELHDQMGLENEKVEFRVHVVGVPPPTISWYKDGFEVFSSRRTKIITEDDRSVFIIHQAALEDEGEIKCTATNRAGHAVTKAQLKLEAPPRIRLPRQYEDGLLFEKGEPIRLKATVAGRPKPRVTWYHNGEVLKKSDRLEIIDSKMGSVLKITDACRSDRGEYGIVGINRIGEDAVFFLVTVTDRPSRPGKVQVKLSENRAKLAWLSPEDDGGCMIGSYIVEYFRVGWDMWLKARNSRQLTASVENLIEGSQYKFRVRAENPYGISDPGEESETVFIPDIKRGIFEPLPDRQYSPLMQEIKRHAEDDDSEKNEMEEAKKRRLLEEKARRLLDAPLFERLSDENFQMGKRKSEPISETIALDGDNENIPPFIPRRKNKGKKRLNLNLINSDSNVGQNLTPSPAEKVNFSGDFSPNFPEVKGIPEEKFPAPRIFFEEADMFTRESLCYLRERDESEIHGSSELMLLIYPRERSKSTELSAHHRSEIEMNLREEGVPPPMSLSSPELGFVENVEFSKIRNAVSSSELLHERTAARLYQNSIEEELQQTVKRRYSTDRKSLERRGSLKEPNLERRLSFKAKKDEALTEEPKIEEKEIPNESTTTPAPCTSSSSPQPKADRERLSSVEKERLEFAAIRERLRKKEEEKRLKGLPLINHYQLSDTTTTTSSSLKTEENENEALNSSSLSEESDRKNDYDIVNAIKSSDLNRELKHSRVPFRPQDDDEIYHPRSKVPVRSVFATVEKPDTESDTSSATATSLANEHPKRKIPKRTSKIFKKFSLKKGNKIPEIAETTTSNDPPPPKPILKNKNPAKSKISPMKRLMPSKATERSVSEEESEGEVPGKKKKVRIAEPQANEESNQIIEKPIDKNSMENQVLIYHYNDILREFGGPDRPKQRPNLNYVKTKQPPVAEEKPENAKVSSHTRNKSDEKLSKTSSKTCESEINAKANIMEPARIAMGNPRGGICASLEYAVDVVMFLLACWLYFFKNELYAIPVLVIMAYRQLKDLTLEKYQKLKNKFYKKIPDKL